MATQQSDTIVRVIVQKLGQGASVEEVVTRLGGAITKDLHIINAFGAELPVKAIPTLAQTDGVRWISLDAPVASSSVLSTEAGPEMPHRLLLPLIVAGGDGVAVQEENVSRKGGNGGGNDDNNGGSSCSTDCPSNYLDTLDVASVWDAGLQGQGIGVAVIDSGISADSDFRVGTQNGGSSRLVKKISFNPNSTTVHDVYGHGTHVAGIIGGNDTDGSGTYSGIAPLVDLLSLKISDDSGMAYESDTVEAMQWVLDNKDVYNIRVVNLSVNSATEQSYHTSPMDAAAEILWFNGVVVVASVGNKGADGNYNTANAAPANDPFIITVGASDEHGTSAISDDTIAPFSAFGMTMDGFMKPDIIAPGKNVYSVLSQQSPWGDEHPDRTTLDGEYFRLSGTSMAAPMVTGAVALLLQNEPNLTPDQVKYRLMNSSTTSFTVVEGNGNNQVTYTYAYLDVYAAVTGTTSESANTGLEASQMLWSGDEPINWNSVNWNSVNWNSVNWNSVNWNSVNWNSVNWNSVNWDE